MESGPIVIIVPKVMVTLKVDLIKGLDHFNLIVLFYVVFIYMIGLQNG